jgi:hypothetical protein
MASVPVLHFGHLYTCWRDKLIDGPFASIIFLILFYGSIKFKTEYLYIDNIVSDKNYYNIDGLSHKDVFNQNGQRVEYVHYGEYFNSKTIYEYDDYQNLIKMTEYENGYISKIIVHEYVYDDKCNIIKDEMWKTVDKFGESFLEPQTVSIRTITYYQDELYVIFQVVYIKYKHHHFSNNFQLYIYR